MVNNGNIKTPVYVENLKQYMDYIRENYAPNSCYFRGETNVNWLHRPYLNRAGSEHFGKMSMRIYKEVLNNYQDVFRDKNPMQVITLLQHYGCPTRLLDVTKDPLVAAFFACYDTESENSNYNANVICIDSFIQVDYNSQFLNKVFAYHELGVSSATYPDYVQGITLGLYSANEILDNYRPILIVPEHLDSRVSAQASAFLYTPLKPHTYSGPLTITVIDMSALGVYLDNSCQHIIIPYYCKELILKDLNDCGICKNHLLTKSEYDFKSIIDLYINNPNRGLNPNFRLAACYDSLRRDF